MRDNRKFFRIETMSKILNVSTSGYFDFLNIKPQIRKSYIDEATLRFNVRKVFAENKKVYGSPKVFNELKQTGFRTSRKRVERIMREEGLYGTPKKRFIHTTDSNHKYPVSPNLLKQDFSTKKSNEKWVSDITYINGTNGWHYVCLIQDLHDKEIVGYSSASHMKASLVIDALEMAAKRRNTKGTIFHSDRGVQYASINFRKRLRDFKIIQSMSAKGNPYDNAPAESLFSVLKREMVRGKIYRSLQSLKSDLFEYIETFYNSKRLHSALGFTSPRRFLKLQLA